MKLKATLLSIFLILGCIASAQPSRSVLKTQLAQQQNHWLSAPIALPELGDGPFLAFSMVWEQAMGTPEVRFAKAGNTWSEWETLPLDSHGEQREGHWVSQLYFADIAATQVQVRAPGDMGKVDLHCYNPGHTPEPSKDTPSTITNRGPVACPCPQPAFEGRLDWCPSGTCPEDITPVSTGPTHLIVHHSAGSNTSTDWAATVRAIWDLHVFVNGWDDIGYNWLIDPTGTLYEGRGEGRLGAHFCGQNGATMGVCVIGDYTNILPTIFAIATLEEMLAWNACLIDVDPLGSGFHTSSGMVLDRISGHRDGCATSCPGDAFYPTLPSVRQGTADFIAESCSDLGAPDGLTAETLSETSIELNWIDEVENETAFELERGLSFNGDYTLIATTDANVTTYTDTGLDPNTGYYYRVRAINDEATSAYSNKAFAFTIVVNTREVEALGTVQLFPNPAKDQVTITWSASLDQPLHVRVFNGIGQEVLRQQAGAAQQQTTLDLPTLPKGAYWVELSTEGESGIYRLLKQ